MKTLETERLILRTWRRSDAGDFFEYARDPAVGPCAGWAPHESKSASLQVIRGFIERDDAWAVVWRETGRVIGSVSLIPDGKRTNPAARALGYSYGRPWWGLGIATEAAHRVIRYGFMEMGLELIAAYRYPFNEASGHVLEKCGFVPEGTLRAASRLYNGKLHDNICYSLLREEYFSRDY